MANGALRRTGRHGSIRVRRSREPRVIGDRSHTVAEKDRTRNGVQEPGDCHRMRSNINRGAFSHYSPLRIALRRSATVKPYRELPGGHVCWARGRCVKSGTTISLNCIVAQPAWHGEQQPPGAGPVWLACDAWIRRRSLHIGRLRIYWIGISIPRKKDQSCSACTTRPPYLARCGSVESRTDAPEVGSGGCAAQGALVIDRFNNIDDRVTALESRVQLQNRLDRVDIIAVE